MRLRRRLLLTPVFLAIWPGSLSSAKASSSRSYYEYMNSLITRVESKLISEGLDDKLTELLGIFSDSRAEALRDPNLKNGEHYLTWALEALLLEMDETLGAAENRQIKGNKIETLFRLYREPTNQQCLGLFNSNS